MVNFGFKVMYYDVGFILKEVILFYEGFCVDLLREMVVIVGFEYKIVLVDDGLYGMLEDGKWNGIVCEFIDRV